MVSIKKSPTLKTKTNSAIVKKNISIIIGRKKTL